MANEDKKDFNAMLHDQKDMPKFQTITDKASIEKYGGDRMYFAPPIDYDTIMKMIPSGKVITVGKIREHFARNQVLILQNLLQQAFLYLLLLGQVTNEPMTKLLTGEH